MALTQEEVHEKIIHLLHHDELKIRASAVVIPLSVVDVYVVDDLQFTKLIINTYSFLGLFPNNLGKNLKQSLTLANRDKIVSKYDLNKYSHHTKLKDVCEYSDQEILLSDVLHKYLMKHINDIRTHSEFFATLQEFFKFMPYIMKYFEGKYPIPGQVNISDMICQIKDKLNKIQIDYTK